MKTIQLTVLRWVIDGDELVNDLGLVDDLDDLDGVAAVVLVVVGVDLLDDDDERRRCYAGSGGQRLSPSPLDAIENYCRLQTETGIDL